MIDWFSLRLLLVVCACGSPLTAVSADDETSFQSTIVPFLQSHCSGCHGEEKQSGERRFDQLTGDISDSNSLAELQDILDQLNLDEMPPHDQPQPSVEQQRTVTQWLTERIANYRATHNQAREKTVLRRLNSREYRNTVRDLLKLNMTMFDPTEGFPREQTTENLDNVGASLVTSGFLLSKYLRAAELVIDKALFPLEKPIVRTWTFHDNFRQQPEIDQVHSKTNNFDYLTLYDVVGSDKHEGGYAPIHAFAEGVPQDGYYEMQFKASALNRLHPFDDDFLGIDRNERLRLGIVAGNKSAGPLHSPQPIEPLLAEIELQDGEQPVTVRVWLDKGFTPRFTFRNGLFNARNLWSKTLKRYPEQFPKATRSGIVEARYLAIKHGKFPQIHIDDVKITGPLLDHWPTASQKILLGNDCEQFLVAGSLSRTQSEKQLARFAALAYRRPAREEEVDRLLQLVAERQDAGQTSLNAFADGLKAVLCSPSFLYLDEPMIPASDDQVPLGRSHISDYALASRLALFLWSSMPDAELMELAAQGKLQQPEILAQQSERMLLDPKSNAFVSDFLDSWLNLRELGASPPDRDMFQSYYHYDLGRAMRQETELFARYLLDENLPIENFIDSEFTFLNKSLARHYGLQPPNGVGFERVSLTDRRRGGLLGQASVLTVTANGIDTSPVVRGVWLLENILGTPPSPPPPDVEPLDPDVRGAITIRDQLDQHRNVPSCFECHRKIDPPGFALENFDAVGAWRERYSKEAKIDASAELPNGKSFQNIVDFKQLLLEQRDQFAQALVEKLLAYSIGRQMTPNDRLPIEQILASTKEAHYRFRDLVKQVIQSNPFNSN